MSKKPTGGFAAPVDPKAADREAKRREESEAGARGLVNGRYLKRKGRSVQIGLKITDEKKRQFDRLRAMYHPMSYTEIFEQALDDFEAARKAEKQAFDDFER